MGIITPVLLASHGNSGRPRGKGVLEIAKYYVNIRENYWAAWSPVSFSVALSPPPPPSITRNSYPYVPSPHLRFSYSQKKPGGSLLLFLILRHTYLLQKPSLFLFLSDQPCNLSPFRGTIL